MRVAFSMPGPACAQKEGTAASPSKIFIISEKEILIRALTKCLVLKHGVKCLSFFLKKKSLSDHGASRIQERLQTPSGQTNRCTTPTRVHSTWYSSAVQSLVVLASCRLLLHPRRYGRGVFSDRNIFPAIYCLSPSRTRRNSRATRPRGSSHEVRILFPISSPPACRNPRAHCA